MPQPSSQIAAHANLGKHQFVRIVLSFVPAPLQASDPVPGKPGKHASESLAKESALVPRLVAIFDRKDEAQRFLQILPERFWSAARTATEGLRWRGYLTTSFPADAE